MALYHGRANSRIGKWVDQDEAAGHTILPIGIEKQRAASFEFDCGDIVHAQFDRGLAVERLHIHAEANLCGLGARTANVVLDEIVLPERQRFGIQPDEHGFHMG